VAVGLVIVCHSALLARGVAEVAGQMAPEVAIGVAGGTDDGGMGTSFELVSEAIAVAEQGDGAVILFDLGSAKMTAELAVEMLEPDRQGRVVVVDAPLVEGAIAAATEAAAGRDLAAVVAAATSAGQNWQTEAGAGPSAQEAAAVEATVTVRNPLGLHARPAVVLARAVRNLDADVRVIRTDTGATAGLHSVLQLVGLATTAGTDLRLLASGPDAEEAVQRTLDLIDGGFGELGS
jgi:dihydroxyacetone kinase phosphotransfer subunit